MQSELSSHIGLKGNLFCRVCTVQGNVSVGVVEDVHDRTDQDQHQDSAGSASEGEQRAKGKKSETMAEMVDRITRFSSVRPPIMCSVVTHLSRKVGTLRRRESTIQQLNDMLE